MTSTVVSWALTLSLVGAGVYYYKPDLFRTSPSRASAPSVVQQDTTSSRPSNKRTKSKKSVASKVNDVDANAGSSSSNEEQSGKKRKIVSPPHEKTNGRVTESDAGHQDDGATGDREFAQQLAKAQSGTNLQKKEDKTGKMKTKKLSKQAQTTTQEPSDFSTEASSTTGRDADDDLTPADSPAIRAADGPARSGDISDMLEAPVAAPTSIRLTGITNEVPRKKKATTPAFEQVLSKKQRQAQAKKEELRQMREESDRIHEAKKQEQLRRARMAAGTSNQIKANNFASSANAWQSGKGNGAVKAALASTTAPLLDTFEPSQNNISQPNGAVHTVSDSDNRLHNVGELRHELGRGGAGAVAASTQDSRPNVHSAWAGNASEEEQMQLLKEQQAEDAWESVTSKKTKKKPRAEGDDGSDVVAAVPAVVAPKSTVSTSTGTTAQNRFNSLEAPNRTGLVDAEWEA